MARDQRGLPPTRQTEVARLADAAVVARGPSFVPRVGWAVGGGGMTGTTAGTPVFQRVYFTPFPVGPTGWTFDAFLFVVSTAFAGGTGTTFTAALYPDDGTGFPNAAAGPLSSTTVATSTLSAGTKILQVNPVVLTPGFYWIATTVNGSAANSAGQMQCVTNTAYQLATPTNLAPGTPVRAYVLNGQTTGVPTSQPADSAFGLTGGNDAPFVTLRRSA